MTGDLIKYRGEIESLIQKQNVHSRSRYEELVITAASAMKHFFDKEVYGDPELSRIDTLPAFWPYVRYLVADRLRSKFGYGEPLFKDVIWDYKFFQDIADEASEIEKLLPEDIKHEEWRFITHVAGTMLMLDPFLIDHGYINEEGRSRLISQSLLAGAAGMEDVDFYEFQFTAWKNQYARLNPQISQDDSLRIEL